MPEEETLQAKFDVALFKEIDRQFAERFPKMAESERRTRSSRLTKSGAVRIDEGGAIGTASRGDAFGRVDCLGADGRGSSRTVEGLAR